MKTYTLHTDYGTYNDIVINATEYYNGNLAITLDSQSEGPFATLTINLDESDDLDKDCAFVDINNCPWALDFIESNDLGKPTGDIGFSGWCMYPAYKFDLEKMRG